MKISIIAALNRKHAIGQNNKMPWHLPADLKRFKILTMGKPIIMGRKTHESIGRVLPGRHNIIVSHCDSLNVDGATLAPSVQGAIRAAGNVPEVMIIGGGELFAQALPLADMLYLTWVDADLLGDTYFPYFDASEWQLLCEEQHRSDATNPFDYCFANYSRVR